MKIYLKELCIIFITVFMISCSNEDDQPAPVETQNVLKVGSEEFELKSGIYETENIQDGLYAFGVILYDTNISIANGEVVAENEIVNGISFEIYIDNNSKPELGQYILTGDENPGVNSLASASTIHLNSESSSSEIIEIEGGRLEILENENKYLIKFTGIDEEDNEISVSFSGNLILNNS